MDYTNEKKEIVEALLAPTQIRPQALKILAHRVMDLLKLLHVDLKSPDPKKREAAFDELLSLKALLGAAQEHVAAQMSHTPSKPSQDPLFKETLQELSDFSRDFLGFTLPPQTEAKPRKRFGRGRISA